MPAHKSERSTQPVKVHTGWLRFLGFVLVVALILCSYLSVLQANFSTAAKTMVFLRGAKVLESSADIIKAEVNDKLPDGIKNNFIKNAIAQKLLDIIVTPENLAKVAEPGLKIAYQVTTKAPTEIQNNQVVLNTQQYKTQAEQFVGSAKLPEVLSQPIDSIIQATPNQLTLVSNVKDSQTNPLVLMIRMRNTLNMINAGVTLMWWIIILDILGIIALSWRQYRRLLHTAAWTFGAAGLFIVVASYMFPPILTLVVPQSTDALIGGQLNDLMANVTNFLFNQTRSYGLFFVLIAIIAYVLKRFDLIAKGVELSKRLWKKYIGPRHHRAHHKAAHKK